MKVLALLNLLGTVQGLLLVIALLTIRRGNRTANRLLAAFVTSTSLQIFGAVLFTTKYVLDYPHLSRLHHPFIYLAGPLLFLYIRALTSQREAFERKDLLHFLPFFLSVIYLLPYFLESAEYKAANLVSSEYERWYYARHVVVVLQAVIYLYFIVRLVSEYTQKVSKQSSAGEKAILLQLRVLVAVMLVVFFGGLIRLLLRDRSMQTNLLLPLCASIMVYLVAWLGLARPETLAGTPNGERVDAIAEEVGQTEASALAGTSEQIPSTSLHSKKYERSTLTPDRAEEYLKKLHRMMETEKPYIDGDLTLQKLAARMAIQAAHLSQIINERLGRSFSDFINGYRIEEAKRRLSDPANKHYSILAIAEEVGFNSKSSFNSIFKKHAGMTPSEFRETSGGNG